MDRHPGNHSITSDSGGGGWFPSTHWTQVAEAGRDSSPGAREAFGGLYRNYRAPLQAYLRSRGNSPSEAEDLLQGFFEFLLAKKGLARVERHGKFRSWLLTCLKNYVSDIHDKSRAAKRGGGEVPVALATGAEDSSPGVDPSHPGRTPDEEYDRQFSLRFLELVRERLEQEFRLGGKQELFRRLSPFLLDKKGGANHADLGRELGMSEVTVSKAISRLRERFRAVFDEQLRHLIGVDGDLEEEKRCLFQALTK